MSRALLHMDSGLLYEEARDFALQKNLSCWVSLANPEGLLDYIIDKRPPLVMPHVLGFKSLENATEYKDMGNISYKKKELETALKYYNSVLLSPAARADVSYSIAESTGLDLLPGH
jgi:hypothetical protein